MSWSGPTRSTSAICNCTAQLSTDFAKTSFCIMKREGKINGVSSKAQLCVARIFVVWKKGVGIQLNRNRVGNSETGLLCIRRYNNGLRIRGAFFNRNSGIQRKVALHLWRIFTKHAAIQRKNYRTSTKKYKCWKTSAVIESTCLIYIFLLGKMISAKIIPLKNTDLLSYNIILSTVRQIVDTINLNNTCKY